MARAMGKAIQEDERFQRYEAARQANDSDEALQKLIGEFNLKRIALNTEAGKPERDQEKIARLNDEMKTVYGQIMANENMLAYQSTKEELDALLSKINMIIVGSANGEDPDSIDTEGGCSGSCSSCSGCH
ncbi:MAG: YlbF family regulator [Clostridiales bacterium]|nr:YlbF family regulator [Clostridiales bacterium]